jgi:3-aminobutyryl-CoA ammonia-lyase
VAKVDLSKYVTSIETRVDSHYPNQVISLGIITELFGMAGGKLSMMLDGDDGYARAFEQLEFVAPAYQGDYVRVTARLLSVGRTSRKRRYEAHVVARSHGIGEHPTSAEILQEPILVAHGIGTAVVPRDRQRLTPPELKDGSE